MREIRPSGSEGGGFEFNRFSLPLSSHAKARASAFLFRLILVNHFYFHQHNGKHTITSLFFSNIMASPISDIFSTFVFNNIMGLSFIFSPRIF